MDNFRKVFQGNLFGSPLNPGIETISLSLFSPQVDPNLTFNNSACFHYEQPL
jgi:hypothetical protein